VSSETEDINFAQLHEQVIEVLTSIFDPEIPVNIYDLGLIYSVAIQPDVSVDVKMTLTSPNCPEAQSLPLKVEEEVKGLDRVTDVRVEIVWDPQWGPDRMSEAARLTLGMD